MTDPTAIRRVLEFWFGAPYDPARDETRKAWWRKNAGFDARISLRFGALHDEAGRGELDDWQAGAEGCLALVILLDQFSRNLYRGDARSWVNDAGALAVARHAIATGFDQGRVSVERVFLYMPFMHSESLADQDQCLALFQALPDGNGASANQKAAQRHREIIERFGRFPHRNEILGRPSTPEEIAFLAQPGSSF